jgi:SSS family solute:Na+ symporter
MNALKTPDYLVFLVYFFIVAGYGYMVYYKKKKSTTTESHDYFLAEGSLTWWAIGASLIASNISAEQFIGMSGNGHLHLRMDGCGDAFNCGYFLYSSLSEE